MAKKYYFSEEQKEEIRIARKENKNKNVERRLLLLLLRSEGVKYKDIANKTGFAMGYISQLVAKYHHEGIKAIIANNYKGNNRNLSFEQEEKLLKPFIEKSEAGQLVDVNEIKIAYEQAVGKSLENCHSQIYYVLERHGFRKIKPRSKHPNKASDEVIETSKKLTT